MDQFDAYIKSLGRPTDTDLYMDIDETMARREAEKPKLADTQKGYINRNMRKANDKRMR